MPSQSLLFEPNLTKHCDASAPLSACIYRFQQNNFDLIRLLAALQVAVQHSHMHLFVPLAPLLAGLVNLFPGVPIFFFVSGLLISRSYERSGGLGRFAINRGLRIYPALWVCTAVSIIAVFLVGYRSAGLTFAEFATWTCAQTTFVQFYNPEFMRGFGVGVLNGSLWTIAVELQFYVLAPCLYRVGLIENRRLIATMLFFLTINRLFYYGCGPLGLADAWWMKVVGVTFAVHFYMFLAGVFVQRNFDAFERVLAGRGRSIVICYLVFATLARQIVPTLSLDNGIHPLLFVPLCLAVFSLAFSCRTCSERLLKGNDISYGLYIYHMPIVNCFRYFNWVGSPVNLAAALVLSIVAGWLSWRRVERPAMALKPVSLKHGECPDVIAPRKHVALPVAA